MSVRKDSYAWLWITLAGIAIAITIVTVVLEMIRPKVTLHLGDGIFTAYVAKTDVEREKGLAGVDDLPKDKAMLFVFLEDGRHGVWMKNMKIPVDIVWLDKQKKVVHVVRDVSPDSYPAVYKPGVNARYVVELASGVAAEKTIRIGTVAQFDEKKATEGGIWQR